ncbi:MAG: elongation factor P [Anaerolineaceae bacterium]|nr:elongation factor P [Anaerolineaceae bacterium]
MIDVNDLRKGVIFELDGSLMRVLEYSHHKPGRGNAVIRIKARNMRTGSTIEKTFSSGDRVQDVRLDHNMATFLYSDDNFFHFMDVETFEQVAVPNDLVGDYAGFLKENMEVKLTFYQEQPLDIELPLTVDLKVVYAEASVRGDTATGVTKKVKTETGAEVSVPMFVSEGDVIRVDTRSGAYITRA